MLDQKSKQAALLEHVGENITRPKKKKLALPRRVEHSSLTMKLDPWITRLHHAAMLAELEGFKHLAAAFRAMIAKEVAK